MYFYGKCKKKIQNQLFVIATKSFAFLALNAGAPNFPPWFYLFSFSVFFFFYLPFFASFICHSFQNSSLPPSHIIHSSISCLQIVSSLRNCFLFLSHFFHLSIHLKSWAPSSGTSCYLSLWPPLFPSFHPLMFSWASSSFCFTLLSTFHPTCFLCSSLSNSKKKKIAFDCFHIVYLMLSYNCFVRPIIVR